MRIDVALFYLRERPFCMDPTQFHREREESFNKTRISETGKDAGIEIQQA